MKLKTTEIKSNGATKLLKIYEEYIWVIIKHDRELEELTFYDSLAEAENRFDELGDN